MTNHPNRTLASLLRQASQCIADNSIALTYAELQGDARRLADVQLERNHTLARAIDSVLARP